MNFGGKDTSVILFSPKSFDEAGELVNYLNQNLTVVMTLEGVQGDMARRLLDFSFRHCLCPARQDYPGLGKDLFYHPVEC